MTDRAVRRRLADEETAAVRRPPRWKAIASTRWPRRSWPRRRSAGSSLRRCPDFAAVAGGGVTAAAEGHYACAGNDAFMDEHGVAVPRGLRRGSWPPRARRRCSSPQERRCWASSPWRTWSRRTAPPPSPRCGAGLSTWCCSPATTSAPPTPSPGRWAWPGHRPGAARRQGTRAPSCRPGRQGGHGGRRHQRRPGAGAADVGLAIGAGTDVAIEAADVVLMNSQLMDVPRPSAVPRHPAQHPQNLFWAFFYNVIGIPLAAGVLFPPSAYPEPHVRRRGHEPVQRVRGDQRPASAGLERPQTGGNADCKRATAGAKYK